MPVYSIAHFKHKNASLFRAGDLFSLVKGLIHDFASTMNMLSAMGID